MSILPGEGSHVILYGSTTFSVVTRSYGGYLARPDVAGSFPAALLLGEVSSASKDLCRHLARHGVAAVALQPESPRAVSDLVRWVSAPGTEWADAARMFAVLMDDVDLSNDTRRDLSGVILLDVPPSDLGGLDVLGVFGGDGPAAGIAKERRLPGSTWAIYAGAPERFWDPMSDGYDDAAMEDVVARMVAFIGEQASEAA